MIKETVRFPHKVSSMPSKILDATVRIETIRVRFAIYYGFAWQVDIWLHLPKH